MDSLKRLRYNRTRASNTVLESIRMLMTQEIKWRIDGRPAVLPDDQYALPSWWPFWSDVLKKNVVEAVRVARKLDAEEARLARSRAAKSITKTAPACRLLPGVTYEQARLLP